MIFSLLILISVSTQLALGIIPTAMINNEHQGVVKLSYYQETCCISEGTTNGDNVLKITEQKVQVFFCPANKLVNFCPRSCQQILASNPEANTGYYEIISSEGTVTTVYCDMEGIYCNNEGGWTRIAYLNMTRPGAICPTGLMTKSYPNVDHQLCSKVGDEAGCSSVYYASPVTYSKVCGQARGYQYGLPDGIGPDVSGSYNPQFTIDDIYVDGLSITYGNNSRQHLWTYVAGGQEIRSSKHDCPCNKDFNAALYSPPSFVGTDYYCESGKPNNIDEQVLYANDPLWDGKECNSKEDACCIDHSLPWFMKTLTVKESSDIEVRACFTSSDENIPIDIIEIYVK